MFSLLSARHSQSGSFLGARTNKHCFISSSDRWLLCAAICRGGAGNASRVARRPRRASVLPPPIGRPVVNAPRGYRARPRGQPAVLTPTDRPDSVFAPVHFLPFLSLRRCYRELQCRTPLQFPAAHLRDARTSPVIVARQRQWPPRVFEMRRASVIPSP
jgi:hypothetical protein